MVFIRQFEVPRTAVSKLRVVPLAMLYVFGTRVELGEGWVELRLTFQQEGCGATGMLVPAEHVGGCAG